MYWIDQAINVLFALAVFTLLVSIAWGVRSLIWGSRNYYRFQRVTILAFVISLLAVFLLGDILSSNSYQEVIDFLENTKEPYQISINGTMAEEKGGVLAMLHTMDNRAFQGAPFTPNEGY